MKRKGTKFHKLVCLVLEIPFRFLYQLRQVGAENEPEEGGFLVCSNHISAADPFLITAVMRNQVHFMAKNELFKIPILSALLRGVGAFPVDRRKGDVGAVKHAIHLLEEGKSMGLFPQGTRHPNEDPRDTDVKNGVAMIAYHANATILPVYIHRKDNSPKMFRKTTVIIGKPIPFSEFGYDPEKKGEYNRIANEIFDKICTLGEEFDACEK